MKKKNKNMTIKEIKIYRDEQGNCEKVHKSERKNAKIQKKNTKYKIQKQNRKYKVQKAKNQNPRYKV